MIPRFRILGGWNRSNYVYWSNATARAGERIFGGLAHGQATAACLESCLHVGETSRICAKDDDSLSPPLGFHSELPAFYR